LPEPGDLASERLRLQLLVLRCQAGDEQAFTTLFNRFNPRTLAYLEGLVGDDAQDVQQEVWLAVYRNLRTLANPGAFRTWLFQTTRHRAVDQLRKRRRSVDWGEGMEQTDRAGGDDGPIDGIELEAIAARLPAGQREVLLLRYGNDLSYGEIALVTGCPVGTVKSRLFAAHRAARAIIDETR
jgi:RNA polymerase sigma-70 factor (ECF subfamily)